MYVKFGRNSIFHIKGPARKATLLSEGENEKGVAIDDELLAILLFYSLPTSHETFRWTVETRDELPKPDLIRAKILAEQESQKSKKDKVGNKNVLYNRTLILIDSASSKVKRDISREIAIKNHKSKTHV